MKKCSSNIRTGESRCVYRQIFLPEKDIANMILHVPKMAARNEETWEGNLVNFLQTEIIFQDTWLWRKTSCPLTPTVFSALSADARRSWQYPFIVAGERVSDYKFCPAIYLLEKTPFFPEAGIWTGKHFWKVAGRCDEEHPHAVPRHLEKRHIDDSPRYQHTARRHEKKTGIRQRNARQKSMFRGKVRE